MKTSIAPAKNVDEYMAAFPPSVRKILLQLRQTIKATIPEAEEAMKYGIPTFVFKGNLVHFGGYKNHIGFYPAPSGIKAFQKELSVYKSSKGAVQFPINNPLPLGLIRKIVKFRVKENKAKMKTNK